VKIIDACAEKWQHEQNSIDRPSSRGDTGKGVVKVHGNISVNHLVVVVVVVEEEEDRLQ